MDEEVSPSKEGQTQHQELAEEAKLSPATSPWHPRQLVFSLYSPPHETGGKNINPLRVVVRKPLIARLTKDIVETYKICNSQFKYLEELKPKRYFTSPSTGVSNGGYDNANSDLILYANLDLVNERTGRRYIIKDILGHGTFGQVAKCWVAETNSFVAVKIIKNQPAYFQQALVEVSILTSLNKNYDPEDQHHIVRIYDHFPHQNHLCIAFELLDSNLYELIKINNFKGLSLSIVQLFSKQILRGLALMKTSGVIHCDLKPENILLCASMKPPKVKIIDFGSACMESRTVYSYIQSRYYRSPEVLLGYQYTAAIDMWSFGCIIAELFLGLPLFPGASEFDLLRRMVKILGGQPPDYILKEAKNTSKFFKCIRSFHHVENAEVSMGGRSAYQALTEEEYEARESKKPSMGKEYFNHMNLEGIVRNYPYRKNLPEEDLLKESQVRLALIDFLRGLVEFDPAKRWSPLQASKHPFVTGEAFTCPYKPTPESPSMPVNTQNVKVDHHPGGGHWFAAGLSPNIASRNRVMLHNSPHFQMVPYAHSSNYGSLGSIGSYNDNIGLGSSYGSYGDNNYHNINTSNNMFAYYSPVAPSGMNMYAQSGGGSVLGTSPDARRRIISQFPHANGLGVSPSTGNFPPMALGSSPSQFTPPNSYGPTSPARSTNCHGSPLGKMAAVSQFNRRKSLGFPGSMQSSHESSPPVHWQGHLSDAGSSHVDGNSQVNWNQQRGSGGGVHAVGYSVLQNMPEGSQSLPDPGDWDPNYSDELLLQDDSLDGSRTNDYSKAMHPSQALGSSEPVVGTGRFNGFSKATSNTQRPNGPAQAYSHLEVGSPSSTQDTHGSSYSRHMSKSSNLMPHFSQNSPSRLGQQSSVRVNHGRSTSVRSTNEWNHIVQPAFSNHISGGPHSPRGSSFSQVSSWGRRANYPITSLPPTSRARNDCGKIS